MLAHCCENPIERRIAFVQFPFHPRLQHAVAILGSVEQRCSNESRPAVAQVLERHGFEGHVARHPVPFEGLDDSFGRTDFSKTPLETLGAVRTMLDKAPMTAALYLEPLDHKLVTTTPPLRD